MTSIFCLNTYSFEKNVYKELEIVLYHGLKTPRSCFKTRLSPRFSTHFSVFLYRGKERFLILYYMEHFNYPTKLCRLACWSSTLCFLTLILEEVSEKIRYCTTLPTYRSSPLERTTNQIQTLEPLKHYKLHLEIWISSYPKKTNRTDLH